MSAVVVATALAMTTPQDISQYQNGDIDLMARVIMSEAGGLEFEGKLGVAACIVNRVNSPDFPNTVSEVIAQPNQFWTGNNGKPTQDCYTAAQTILISNPYPDDLYYFRLNYPHSFGYEYMQVGNTYFSTKTEHNNEEE